MKTFHFLKNKYGAEILMDIGKYEDIPTYFFEDTLHTTDFYEIVFFLKGNGHLELDNQQIKLRNHSILFLSPYQKRRWFVDKSKIDCYFLLFQDGFLSSFFSDKLFTYKLQYFYNKSNPLFIQPTPEFTNQLHSAIGPAIQATELPPISALQIAPSIARILGIQPPMQAREKAIW